MQKVCILLLVILSAVAEDDLCDYPCPPTAPPCHPIRCPEGTVVGWAHECQCCPSCVILEGDSCPWRGPEPPSGPVECEKGTECCDWECCRDCDK
ncbi:unnamed protein product [Ceutorhynchus assimilis]|uniref:Uncharacterized protein n=1 Tax=Ceutorhynchus assimilis TaxID=467358 RepID=A0A9N9MWI6_9CUCU|nr:unnamed protein product [Ceutorhynchus assimilis]